MQEKKGHFVVAGRTGSGKTAIQGQVMQALRGNAGDCRMKERYSGGEGERMRGGIRQSGSPVYRGLMLSGTKTHVKQCFLPLTPLLMAADALWSPVLPV